MIQYGKGDLDLLLDRIMARVDLTTNYPINDPNHHRMCTLINISGELIPIECDTLIQIVLWEPPKDYSFVSTLGHTFKVLFELIHMRVLEDIPLFINSYPDVAKWRLEIGK
jgi:hypothetical protein